MDRENLLIRTFVELADNLVADFDIIDVLSTLARRGVRLLGVDAAGILLPDHRDRLRVVAASSEESDLLSLFELQAANGPAAECFATGQGQSVGDLSRTRWPDLATAAAALDLHSTEARPLRRRREVIGVFMLVARSSEQLATADVAVAQALADVATISVLQFRELRDARVLSDQLQEALNSRIVIEQAKGVLCERWQTTMDDAFGRLRRHARATNRRLSDVALDVTTGDLRVDDMEWPSVG